MSYAPFDGVLLDDLRPTVPGAYAMLLHMHVAEQMGQAPNKDAITARAGACSELLAHGLLPETLKSLSICGLEFGNLKSPHSLASVIRHLELFLEAVESAGYIEPNAALWHAVDAESKGRRGLWSERTAQDGPLEATLSDLQPARLRALACLPQLGGATFRLATRKGGSISGLFGSGQPLVDWFLDGLETYGQAFTADLQLAEPEGWGLAPWSNCLDSLFENTLNLDAHNNYFQRGLVDGPFDLIHCAVEQIISWVNHGVAAQDITVIHAAPENIREYMETLLGAEGVPLNSSRAFRPLIQSEVWSPIWAFLKGLLHLDPYAVATGLHVSRRPELRAWADFLLTQDQTGQSAFQLSIDCLPEHFSQKAINFWHSLNDIRAKKTSPAEWCETLNDIVSASGFPLDSDDYYAPLGLMRECLGKPQFSASASSKPWGFEQMLASLNIFLESARSTGIPLSTGGIRLIPPSSLLDDWEGSVATLILDLSEGVWPARPVPNPDLDWTCRSAINNALLAASKNYSGAFPPAMQRFWLPKIEHTAQMPRAFQKDAYAFNKALAMTSQYFLALSPTQDESGRQVAQGAFWTAIDGAGEWEPDRKTCASNMRWAWEGFHRLDLADKRSSAVQVLGTDKMLNANAPFEDFIPDIQSEILRNQDSAFSPTVLESLARCPFRAVVGSVWRLDTDNDKGRVRKSVGTLIHTLLEILYKPLVAAHDFPNAFTSYHCLNDTNTSSIESLVNTCWYEALKAWQDSEKHLSTEQQWQTEQEAKSLLPNVAAYIRNDIEESYPTLAEQQFVTLEKIPICQSPSPSSLIKEGWQRTLIGIEYNLGPVSLQIAADQAMILRGRIDRIELWENTKEQILFHRITDYKTSGLSRIRAFAAEDAPFVTHLQVPLYAWMATVGLGKYASSVLIPLTERNPKPYSKHLNPLVSCNLGGSRWQDKLGQILVRLAARIKHGNFPPTPGAHCLHCPFSALCMRPVDVTASGSEEEDQGSDE